MLSRKTGEHFVLLWLLHNRVQRAALVELNGTLVVLQGAGDGDRIAQMVIAQYTQVTWNEVSELNQTERGDGGFGHTGKK